MMTAKPVFHPFDAECAVDGDDDQKSGIHPSAKREGSRPEEEEDDDEPSAIERHAAVDPSVVEARSLHIRTQFLRRVAHDIASPTGVAMTVLEEIAAESASPHMVAMARRGLRRLLRLSEQLALVADLEAGDVIPETAVCDLREVVKEAVDNALAIDGRRDVELECRLPDMRLMADADRRLLSSTLREIVGNAIRLASKRVSVDVELIRSAPAAQAEPTQAPIAANTPPVSEELARPKEEERARHVRVRIEDDGGGFSEETRSTLGQRFVPRPCTRGLGLSISMAKEILDAHGGTIRFEQSTLPLGRRGTRGAAVVITLPLR